MIPYKSFGFRDNHADAMQILPIAYKSCRLHLNIVASVSKTETCNTFVIGDDLERLDLFIE